jgi:hypothetical protein
MTDQWKMDGLTYEEFEAAIRIRLIEEEQKLFPLVWHSFVVVDST